MAVLTSTLLSALLVTTCRRLEVIAAITLLDSLGAAAAVAHCGKEQ